MISLKLVKRHISGKYLTIQAQEVIFSRKLKKRVRPKKFFDDGLVVHFNYQKHLGMYLDVLYQRKNFESYQRHWIKFGN